MAVHGPRAAVLLSTLMLLATAVPVAAGGSTGGPAVPRFRDETKASKLKHTYAGDWQYFVGGGVATFDCDDNGLPELYLAGGTRSAGLWRNTSKVGGALRFARIKDPATDLKGVTGAYPLDIDGDAITDLAVLRVGETTLLRGVGDCVFEPANEAWSFASGTGWSTAFAATWEGDAALPTLAFGSYVDVATSDERIGNCAANALVRPNDAATGYEAPIALEPGYCSLSMLFSDWGRTGQVDLRVSNDRHYAPQGEEQLWRITPDAAPTLYTEADGWQKLVIWGMGIGSRDLTGDGRPEVYLTSQADNKLQTLVADATGPTYEDIALARGVTAAQPFTGGDPYPSTAWHPAFEDVNNDGLVDLFVAKGNVEAQPGYAVKDPSNLLLQHPDGTFTEAAEDAGLLTFDRGRGAAVVDLNLDGMLDVVEVMRVKPTRIWRNLGSGTAKEPAAMGHWVAVRLRQEAANRDAVGSWVEVRIGDVIQTRELTVGGGHVSGDLGFLHYGLGTAAGAEVRVTWPDGEVGPWLPIAADSRYLVTRGAELPTPVGTAGPSDG